MMYSYYNLIPKGRKPKVVYINRNIDKALYRIQIIQKYLNILMLMNRGNENNQFSKDYQV